MSAAGKHRSLQQVHKGWGLGVSQCIAYIVGEMPMQYGGMLRPSQWALDRCSPFELQKPKNPKIDPHNPRCQNPTDDM